MHCKHLMEILCPSSTEILEFEGGKFNNLWIKSKCRFWIMYLLAYALIIEFDSANNETSAFK